MLNKNLLKYQLKSSQPFSASMFILYMAYYRTNSRIENLFVGLIILTISLPYYKELIGEEKYLFRLIPVDHREVQFNYLIFNLGFTLLLIGLLVFLELVFDYYSLREILFSREYLMAAKRTTSLGRIINILLTVVNFIIVGRFIVGLGELVVARFIGTSREELAKKVLRSNIVCFFIGTGLALGLMKLSTHLARTSPIIYSFGQGRLVNLKYFQSFKLEEILKDIVTVNKFAAFINLKALWIDLISLGVLVFVNYIIYKKLEGDYEV